MGIGRPPLRYSAVNRRLFAKTRMFTGIITGIGQITRVYSLGDSPSHGKQLQITAPPEYLCDVQAGDSIALNGACMTVAALDRTTDTFTVDISGDNDILKPSSNKSFKFELTCDLFK